MDESHGSAIPRSDASTDPFTSTQLAAALTRIQQTPGSQLHSETTNAFSIPLLKFAILPRRHVSISVPAAMPGRGGLGQVSKRLFEASQPVFTTAKKVKRDTEDPSLEPVATMVFQAGPVRDGMREIVLAKETLANSGRVVSVVGHPLAQLSKGDTVNVINAQGQDHYTLTYCQGIVLLNNSLLSKARHSGLPEAGAVVVKVLRTPSDPVGPGVRDESASRIVGCSNAWLREYKNHAKLCQHTAVVRLYEGDSRFLSLYMEHVDGPNLASYRVRTPSKPPWCTLGVDDAWRILADMTTALSYVHGQRVVRNDIKPANILFSRTRGAVLTDFGLSSDLDDRAVSGGSPWYLPPEHLVNGNRGASGDVFALGVVMTFLLGNIPLPDMHPQPNWSIVAVCRGPAAPQSEARNAMWQWLEIVEKASQEPVDPEALREVALGALVRQMLLPVPHRISIAEILQRLFPRPS